MMANVLGAKKDSLCQRLEKDARFHQSGDRLQTKTAERFHLFGDLTQLRYSIGVEIETSNTVAILFARVRSMCWAKRLPNSLPNPVFFGRIWGCRNLSPWLIAECNLCDVVSSSSIFRVFEPRMIRIEFHQRFAIVCFSVCRDQTHVDVVKK